MKALTRNCFCGTVMAVFALPAVAGAGIDRFGGTEKVVSYGVFLGSGFYTGSVSSQGTFDFASEMDADALFGSPESIALEYAESIGKSSLATGLEFTRVDELNALSTALGLSEVPGITVTYLDIPVTYRANAFSAGRGEFNVFAGVAIVAMFDFLKAADAIFLTAGEGASSTGGGSDKHVDFGLGLGGEFGAEVRLRGSLYMTGKAGFRNPFTGITRPKAGFAQIGLRWFEF